MTMKPRNLTAWHALQIAVGAIYVFMLGPILITAAVSFNAANAAAEILP